jgi:hypothetical protein
MHVSAVAQITRINLVKTIVSMIGERRWTRNGETCPNMKFDGNTLNQQLIR